MKDASPRNPVLRYLLRLVRVGVVFLESNGGLTILEHVISRNENSMERLVVQGKRARGRSPTRWIDAITKATESTIVQCTRNAPYRGYFIHINPSAYFQNRYKVRLLSQIHSIKMLDTTYFNLLVLVDEMEMIEHCIDGEYLESQESNARIEPLKKMALNISTLAQIIVLQILPLRDKTSNLQALNLKTELGRRKIAVTFRTFSFMSFCGVLRLRLRHLTSGGGGQITLHSFPNPDKEPDRFRSWIYAVKGDIILALDNKVIPI
ncbi:unnamed protein product [Leptidea sinapis]|uniref:Uncharacterized protein n=1 Tax=Leptidea sinapis TaxID=189913 RepID=A0A5E4R5E5_9NEOP|nr:unnamed protein product [Leptidea sinapis]